MPKKSDLTSLLDNLVDTPAQALDQTIVPNKFPLLTSFPYKIAIIGEAPGADELQAGEPFVGQAGRELNKLLSRASIVRDACFVGNICQHRPPVIKIKNKLKQMSPLEWAKKSDEGKEALAEGMRLLTDNIAAFKPNLCVLLGNNPLWAAKDNATIGDWRGSIFICDKSGPFFGNKCLPSYHPSAIFQEYQLEPLLMFDLKKARVQGEFSSFIPPQRDLKLFSNIETLLYDLQQIKLSKPPIAIDIEGWVDKFVCISVAPTDTFSFIVPLANRDNSNFYSNVDDEISIWKALSDILADVSIPKILQNSLYDRFVLQYSYDIVIRGVVDDTMLKNHELYCELEKSLGFMCSIYTDEPYYKHEGKSDSRDKFWEYCCRDSAVTLEINNKLIKWLDSLASQHYRFNIDMLNPLLYMELRGIRYNTELAKKRLAEVEEQVYTLQYELDKISGFGITDLTTSRSILMEKVSEVMLQKSNKTKVYSDYIEVYPLVRDRLLDEKSLDKAFFGWFNTICKLGLNIEGKKFKPYIYETLGCPKQYNQKTEKLTTDGEAMLKLSKKVSHPAIPIVIDLAELRTRAEMLHIHTDNDGRMRCGYNVVGTETGRLSCYTSPTGSGYNLTTIPAEQVELPITNPLRKGMRDLFIADEGSYMFQCDLSGADGWTVAAYMASLGDRTMLDDYLFGIKPAKVLCYMLRNGVGSLLGKSRQEIKELTKSIEKDSWDYFASKIGQHGTCYLMGPRQLANKAFDESRGKLVLSDSESLEFQRLFKVRYKVETWHNWASNYLSKQSYPPKLTCASGHTRKFFGRSREILGEFLAHAPQSNTTYACNLLAYRLWTDNENRMHSNNEPTLSENQLADSAKTLRCDRSSEGRLHEAATPLFLSSEQYNSERERRISQGCKLRAEPLHQIHDAILGQFKIKDTTWAISKIKQWSANQIVIAGIPITIPFEGSYGHNWALDKESKVGDIV